LFRPGDFFEDLACGLCPDEEFGIGIVVLQVLHDGALEFGDAVEGARRMRFRVISAKKRSTMLSQDAESGEVQVEARMRREPALYGGVLWWHSCRRSGGVETGRVR